MEPKLRDAMVLEGHAFEKSVSEEAARQNQVSLRVQTWHAFTDSCCLKYWQLGRGSSVRKMIVKGIAAK
jgi:hypothetical protein